MSTDSTQHEMLLTTTSFHVVFKLVEFYYPKGNSER